MERDEFWRGHVDAFQRQRGTQRDYCDQHGLSARELRKWRTRFYGPVRMRVDPEPGPVPVEAGLSEFSYAVPMGPDLDQADEPTVVGSPILRRRWTDEQKRQLVWEGLNSGQSLARYARRHGIHPSVAHRWLRSFARPILARADDPAPAAFAAVRLEEAPPVAALIPAASAVPAALPASAGGRIEIELAGGRCIRVGHDVDVETLRRVMMALETLS